MTPGRRSRGARFMPLSTPKGCRCGPSFIPRASRTAMARRLSSIKSVTVFPGSNWSGRTMATTRGKSKPPLPKFRCCASKSSSAATTRNAMSSCRSAGSSSELSLGLAAIAASPRITKISPGPSPPSSHWPASRSPSDDSRDSCLLSQALSSSCPNGSKEHLRQIHNEDINNKKSSTGHIFPNNKDVYNNKSAPKGRTWLHFCLFTPSFGPGMRDFPDIGITYGVFAGKVAPPTGAAHRNYWLARGTVFTDDENEQNQDGTTLNELTSSDDGIAAGAGVTISSAGDGGNTNFYIAKVRDKTGVCSRDVSWWDGTHFKANFDSFNCIVGDAPLGSQPFVRENKYYIEPVQSQKCPLGTLQGGRCFISFNRPGGFISENAFYVPVGNGCPLTPGWKLAGPYCVLVAPLGTQAEMSGGFKGGLFFTTTLFTCQNGPHHLKVGALQLTDDVLKCYMGTPLTDTIAFIWANNFYYSE